MVSSSFENGESLAGEPELLHDAEPQALESPQEETGKAPRLSRGLELALYGGILLIAVAMRLWDLGAQAVHHDESIHALFAWKLSMGQAYAHDPTYHGPFQYHGTALTYFLFGDSDYTARLLPALFGTALVALPFLLRDRLGQIGALLTAVLLAFSPTLLYFSRFARNDIYMAVWTLGLVIVVWKYLDTRQHRYVYLTAALLSLAFATKETAYITALVLGSFLFILAIVDLVPWVRGRLKAEDASPPARLVVLMVALLLPLGAASISFFDGVLGTTLANPDWTLGPVGLPLGLGAGVLPGVVVVIFLLIGAMLQHRWWQAVWLLSAAVFWVIWLLLFTTVFASGWGVALAAEVAVAIFLLIGVMLGRPWWKAVWLLSAAAFWGAWLLLYTTVFTSGWEAGVIAAEAVVIFLLIGAMLGHHWWKGVWWRSAALFWGIWLVLYTTVFTNLAGIASGLWQSLGYWLVQQDVARGGQPWYYYFVITPVYELLPLVVALVGGVYYAIKGDRFSRFLVYWAVLTFVLYSIAAEKMPWLLVNVTLPIIILAGKFLGDAAIAIPWRRVMARGGWAIIPLVPAFFLFATRLALFQAWPDELTNFTTFALLTLLVLGIVGAVIFLAARLGPGPVLRVAALTLAGFLFLFSVRAGWMASYKNSDIPVEMLVYTQSSPAIPRIAQDIEELRERNGGTLRVAVDSTDGYAWPWAWYLRDTEGVSYPCLSADAGCGGMKAPPDAEVVLLAARNEPLAKEKMDGYTRVELYEHRWWFPENYRDVTPAKLFQGLTSRDTWKTMLDYFFYRRISGSLDSIEDLGSSDAVLYYSKELGQQPLQP